MTQNAFSWLTLGSEGPREPFRVLIVSSVLPIADPGVVEGTRRVRKRIIIQVPYKRDERAN